MEKIWILFFLVCNSGSHLTSAVYVRSPEEVVVGNGTTDTVVSHKCGVPAIKPKVPGCSSDGLGIINGEEAVPNSWPWQASLQDNAGWHHCGGSLIHENWVVTAAHCGISESHRVILGLHHRKKRNDVQNMRIGKVFNHPNWNINTNDYDITLIKLQSSAQMNKHVSPVCMAETSEIFFASGVKCVATGWGWTKGPSINHPAPDAPLKLQQVCLPIIGHDQCKRDYLDNNGRSQITGQMICAGAAGSGTCHGDSGGPLVCMKNGAWTLLGVTSFGKIGCLTNMPGVFAYVPNLRAWMDKTVADN